MFIWFLVDVIYTFNVVNFDLLKQMTGCLDERKVVLTCEVHGFLPSTNHPIWRLRESCTLSSSLSKFFIMTGTTTQSSVLISNGTCV